MLPVCRLRQFGCAAILLGAVCSRVTAQVPFSAPHATRSVSGQFIITGAGRSRLAATPAVATNAEFVCLEPALLAVSAERIREAFHRTLNPEFRGLPVAPPRAKVYLVLHPARSTNETVTIASRHAADGWDYQIELPDVLPRTRFVRALTGALLLQAANRDPQARAAEIPAWLTDGLSEELIAVEGAKIILSSPARMVNGQPGSRLQATVQGLDSLAWARRVLQGQSPLTVGQLSWPVEAQLTGADGGVYRASAQLFVRCLLDLKDGPAHLRGFIAALSEYYNWQTAFQSVYRAEFPRPLDVEKWWAVQVVSFAAHDPGPAWTPAVSRDTLDEILRVAVEWRTKSNALPAHAEISLQAVLRNFDPPEQAAILQPKLRDLELAQLRMAPVYAALTDGYRRALADYLEPGQRARPAPPLGKHPPPVPPAPTLAGTLKKLDALDAQRRDVESSLKRSGASP
ncbi:MAG TPA: hypothetical protein VMB80_09075 [Candidatus Acidoferrum sp.]|nr:hypothetical protein [Candidatus Acidoferrum sp.]